MINSTEFTKRLQKVIDCYDESASSFAEKIGVQRSSISHILSGRNKPSLDFVNGKGEFPKTNLVSHAPESNHTKSESVPEFSSETATNEIEKIVVFYKNGTFKSYKP